MAEKGPPHAGAQRPHPAGGDQQHRDRADGGRALAGRGRGLGGAGEDHVDGLPDVLVLEGGRAHPGGPPTTCVGRAGGTGLLTRVLPQAHHAAARPCKQPTPSPNTPRHAQIELRGDGILTYAYAEAIQVGEVRGFVHSPAASWPSSSMSPSSPLHASHSHTPRPPDIAARSLGQGTCVVKRILYKQARPSVSVVELTGGDVTTDMRGFFQNSEQVTTALNLQTVVDEHTGQVVFSGGYMAQLLTGSAPHEDKWHRLAQEAESTDLRQCFDQHEHDLAAVLGSLGGGVDQASCSRTPIDFFCRCSKDSFKKRLVTLAKEEVVGMRALGQRSLSCHFCNEEYVLSDNDFEDVFEAMKQSVERQQNRTEPH